MVDIANKCHVYLVIYNKERPLILNQQTVRKQPTKTLFIDIKYIKKIPKLTVLSSLSIVYKGTDDYQYQNP